MLNLDTHILLHALTGHLTRREREVLNDPDWSISAIVLWELVMLSRRNRVEIELKSPELISLLTRLHVWPIDWAVCRTIDALDFDSDPADSLIAATSIVHRVPLVTRDRTIRKSRVVPLA